MTGDPRLRNGLGAPLAVAATFAAATVMSASRGHVPPGADLAAIVVLVVGRYGDLSRHGRRDVVRLALLLGCGLLAGVREPHLPETRHG